MSKKITTKLLTYVKPYRAVAKKVQGYVQQTQFFHEIFDYIFVLL